MSDILKIEPHINLNTISIWEPRWHDRTVLISTARVKEHNRIVFTKAKSLEGKEFFISWNKLKTYKKESNGKIMCYVVPLDDLKEMRQERRVW